MVDIQLTDTLPDGWRLWLDWHRAIAPDNAAEISALEEDRGRYMGYVRAVARRRADAHLEEPITSAPTNNAKRPLLRGSSNIAT